MGGITHLRTCINEKTCACEYHVQKIGDLKEVEEAEKGQKHLSPKVSGLGISPVAELLALSSFPKLLVVPTESCLVLLGVGGGGAVASGDASLLRGSFTSEATRSARRDMSACSCVRSLSELEGGRNGLCCPFNDFVSHVSEGCELHCIVSGGKNHSNVGR